MSNSADSATAPTVVLVHGAFADSSTWNGVIPRVQRPIAEAGFSEPNGPPAWQHLPSWAVVATGNKAAGADVVRGEAERAGSKITEIEGSHVIMISQPQAVTEVILEAVAAVRSRAVATPA